MEQSNDMALESSIKKVDGENTNILIALLGSTGSYHAQKENQAYVAFTLYIGFMGKFIMGPWKLSNNDSVCWGLIQIFSLVAIFIVSLYFIYWQLENRRYAAIRNTGIDNVLQKILTDTSLNYNPKEYTPSTITGMKRFFYRFWPSKEFGIEIDSAEETPKCLVDEWKELEENGENGLSHEVCIIRIMDVFFLIAFVRCIVRNFDAITKSLTDLIVLF